MPLRRPKTLKLPKSLKIEPGSVVEWADVRGRSQFRHTSALLSALTAVASCGRIGYDDEFEREAPRSQVTAETGRDWDELVPRCGD